MQAAFEGADIVYPKSWAPFSIMQKRTTLLRGGQSNAVEQLEKEALAENSRHTDWECTEGLMKATRAGRALYMHCLPADISGVSCKQGEVAATVFDRYRNDTYREAGHKPFVIAAMMLLTRFERPAEVLGRIAQEAPARRGALR
jgi:ornithine carbamoyltransferase